jgi:hypothetical protein
MDHPIPMTAPFIGWFIAVPVSYIVFVVLFRQLDLWPTKTRGGSRASDMMAFLLVAGICVTYLGIAGCIAWFRFFPEYIEYDTMDNNHFYGKSQFVEDHLIAPMLAYQGWNLLLCFLNKDLMDPAMIGHHLVTGSLAYFGLAPYLHYHGLFFFGFAEVTNIPLTFVDIFKYMPELKEKIPIFNEVCRITFAVSFIIIRLIIWPFISFDFVKGSIALLQSGKAHSNFVVGFFVFANVFLTGLQFFWGSKIFGFLFKKKSKDKKDSNKSK